MATDAPTLLSDAKCFLCNGDNDYSLLLMKLSLLRQLVVSFNPMANTTPQYLLAQAKCYQCYAANPYMLQLIELGLLKQLTDTFSGGPATVVWQFNGAPDIPGGDIYIIAFNRQPGCNSIWWWNPILAVWTQFDVEGMTGNFVVPTIVELRQIVTVDCPPVSAVTLGNLVVGDGQGAHYYFDADDVQADNGMSIIVPNDIIRPDPGSWLQFSPA